MGASALNGRAAREGRVHTTGAPLLEVVRNDRHTSSVLSDNKRSLASMLRETAEKVETEDDLYRSMIRRMMGSDLGNKILRNAASTVKDIGTFVEFARHFTSFDSPFALNEARLPLEIAELMSSKLLRDSRDLPKGNGEPVAFFPGFLAGDFEFIFLRQFYEKLNYDVRLFGIRSNIDSTRDTEERVRRKIEQIYEETNQRVLIVGHSRGGTQGLLMGLNGSEHQELIRGVMTMGSPIRPPFGFTRMILLAALPIGLGNGLSHGISDIRKKIMAGATLDAADLLLVMAMGGFHNIHRELEAARRLKEGRVGVPLVTLSSRSDGVVEFDATTREDASMKIEVKNCSHLGFVANPRSFVAQAEAAHMILSGRFDAKPAVR